MKKFACILFLMVLNMVNCAGQKGALYFEPENISATLLKIGEERDCQILASGGWQFTGYTVNAGDVLRITADGTVQLDPILLPNITAQGIRWGLNSIYPDWLHGTLIARVGRNGSPFLVGTGVTAPVEDSGRIYMRVNDDYTRDNDRGFTVRLKVISSKMPVEGQEQAKASVQDKTPQPAPKNGKAITKIVVWDLEGREVKETYAKELASILVSEIVKLRVYEVYSKENVRALAGWTEERMKLGCTNTQCLTALGQMDIAKLVSGSVGKIWDIYTISLNLFDTQNGKAENAVSEFGRSENELIHLMQTAVKKLLGAEMPSAK